MQIDESLTVGAVLERLGREGASDYEAQVMRAVLLEQYPGRELESLSEAEWLRSFGEMNLRKTTGWIKEEKKAPES